MVAVPVEFSAGVIDLLLAQPGMGRHVHALRIGLVDRQERFIRPLESKRDLHCLTPRKCPVSMNHGCRSSFDDSGAH